MGTDIAPVRLIESKLSFVVVALTYILTRWTICHTERVGGRNLSERIFTRDHTSRVNGRCSWGCLCSWFWVKPACSRIGPLITGTTVLPWQKAGRPQDFQLSLPRGQTSDCGPETSSVPATNYRWPQLRWQGAEASKFLHNMVRSDKMVVLNGRVWG